MIRALFTTLLLSSPGLSQTPLAKNVDFGKNCGPSHLHIDPLKLGKKVYVTASAGDLLACTLIMSVVASPPVPVGNHNLDLCYLHVIPLWHVPIPQKNPSLLLGKVPDDKNLVGQSFYFQAVCWQIPWPNWTQGVKATIGY